MCLAHAPSSWVVKAPARRRHWASHIKPPLSQARSASSITSWTVSRFFQGERCTHHFPSIGHYVKRVLQPLRRAVYFKELLATCPSIHIKDVTQGKRQTVSASPKRITTVRGNGFLGRLKSDDSFILCGACGIMREAEDGDRWQITKQAFAKWGVGCVKEDIHQRIKASGS